MKVPRPKPWWCDCDSGEGYDGRHEADCFGNSPMLPRTMAALAERERATEKP